MSAYPDAIKPKWLKPGPRWVEVLVISELTPWVSHWDARAGKSRRCGQAGCALCAQGYQKQLRVVLMGLDASQRDVLVELRERHRSMLDGFESVVGLVVRIRKAGSARNSPVEMEVKDRRNAAERDISRLVDCFGMEPLYLHDAEEQIERSVSGLVAEIDRLDPTDRDDCSLEEAKRFGIPNPPGYEDFE